MSDVWSSPLGLRRRVEPARTILLHGSHQLTAPHEALADLLSRAVVVSLFTLLTVRIAANVIETGHVTGLLLLVSELIVVVLTVIRRRAVVVDRSRRGRLLTALSMAGPPLVFPVAGVGLVADTWTAACSGAGLLVIIAGKLSLGRSFGLVPANRGIVSSGIYRFVRHPIYLGYLITHAAFVVANPTLWNLSLLSITDAALLLRAVQEERTLVADPAYADYCARTRWRVLPGVF